MQRKYVARIVMLRGLGFSTEKIGKMICSERDYSQSSVSKQLRRIRNSIIDGGRDGPSTVQPGTGTRKDVYKKHLFWLEDLDSDDLWSLGSRKYDYQEYVEKHGLSELEALTTVAPEYGEDPEPYHRLIGREENA